LADPRPGCMDTCRCKRSCVIIPCKRSLTCRPPRTAYEPTWIWWYSPGPPPAAHDSGPSAPTLHPGHTGGQKGSSGFISVSIAGHAEHLRHDGLARAHTFVERLLRLPMGGAGHDLMMGGRSHWSPGGYTNPRWASELWTLVIPKWSLRHVGVGLKLVQERNRPCGEHGPECGGIMDDVCGVCERPDVRADGSGRTSAAWTESVSMVYTVRSQSVVVKAVWSS
jgi:hypothetical protein